MNTLLHNDRDDDVDDMRVRGSGGSYGKDREITLGTTMLIGIFFALAVFAAVFFGFGYSMGAKHTASTVATVDGPSSTATFGQFKPSPSNPLGSATKMPAAAPGAPVVVTPPVGVKTVVPVKQVVEEPTVSVETLKPVLRPVPPAPAATPAVAVSGGQSVVQVAAVSHQEDADLLVSTLKRRGYAVAIHSEAQDKLLHVQIGPFSSRKEADAMRQKLLADGFNAIVK